MQQNDGALALPQHPQSPGDELAATRHHQPVAGVELPAAREEHVRVQLLGNDVFIILLYSTTAARPCTVAAGGKCNTLSSVLYYYFVAAHLCTVAGGERLLTVSSIS